MARLLAILVVAGATLAVAQSALAAQPRGYYTSEYGMAAKLEAKYDFASCHGLRRYGTWSFSHPEYGWVPGYWRYECSYHTQFKVCYGGQFESDAGKKPRQWYARMLSPGRCYAR